MAKWRESADAKMIAERMERSRIDENSFDGFEYSEHVVVVAGMVDMNASIIDTERSRILKRASFDAAKKPPITAESLIRAISHQETAYLRQPIKKYWLVTSISLNLGTRLPGRLTCGARISVGTFPSKRAGKEHASLVSDASHSLVGKLPLNYAPVTVRVEARSPHEAGMSAIDRLDTLRGIWNWSVNRGKAWRKSGGPPKPVNTIFLGPVHTLHSADGSLASDSWWYDPTYIGPGEVVRRPNELAELLWFEKMVRRHLQKSPAQGQLLQALLRYGRALDFHDLNAAFLQLWGVLELLTVTTAQSYSVTAKRAAGLFAERSYAFQVLSYLAEYRNRFVHAGFESDDAESLLYMLKRHVEALLSFQLDNAFGFRTLEEGARFLELPSDTNELGRQVKRLRQAVRFRSPPGSP